MTLQNQNFHLNELIASGAPFAPATSVNSSTLPKPMYMRRDGEIGKLYLRVIPSGTINTATDAVYILQHETEDAVGIRMKDLLTDTTPQNLLEGFNGSSAQVNDVIAFRVPPFMSLEFYSSDSGISWITAAAIVVVTNA